MLGEEEPTLYNVELDESVKSVEPEIIEPRELLRPELQEPHEPRDIMKYQMMERRPSHLEIAVQSAWIIEEDKQEQGIQQHPVE